MMAKPVSSRPDRRAVDYIHASLMLDLSLRDIARGSELSVFHFSRAFRMKVGQSPFSYLQSCRFAVAETLLRQLQVDLDDVARLSGFQNARRLRAAIRAQGNR